jgi:hypothetical protein
MCSDLSDAAGLLSMSTPAAAVPVATLPKAWELRLETWNTMLLVQACLQITISMELPKLFYYRFNIDVIIIS